MADEQVAINQGDFSRRLQVLQGLWQVCEVPGAAAGAITVKASSK